MAALSISSRLRWRTILTGVLVGVGTALLIGIPTDVIPNDYFSRMTPVRQQDYFFLALTALLTGLVAASYTVPASGCGVATGKVTTAGLLGFLAVGCPVCNKVVLLLLGTSGAFAYWAPLQPLVGLASMLLLGATLWLRLRAVRTGCPTLA